MIQPRVEVFKATMYSNYAETFRKIAQDPELDAFFDYVRGSRASVALQGRALADVARALTVLGIGFADLKSEGLLFFSQLARRAGMAPTKHKNVAVGAWQLLYSYGHFPAAGPPTVVAAQGRGQLSIEQLIDRHAPRSPELRALFVEYLRRRSAGLDYNTLNQLTRTLVRTFWGTVEKVNPHQTDLRLSDETYQQWKQEAMILPNGRPRLQFDEVLMKVRSFYLDLQSWAFTEPEIWARWVAPCPVRDTEVRWTQVNRRRLNERMADRTRIRQPLLPILVDHVTDRWLHLRGLLAATTAADLGEEFDYAGNRWQRTASKHDHRQAQADIGYGLRVLNRDTGELVRITHEEDGAFFDWAMVEILRHAGLRTEELLELSHLSVRNYQRTNGEVVALLVIAPSKTDRERVIPMSAELFHAVAQSHTPAP